MSALGVNTPYGPTGDIRATGEITAYYSDRRLKNNVKVIENALDKLQTLTGITYTHNELAASFGYDTRNRIVGVFASLIYAFYAGQQTAESVWNGPIGQVARILPH